MKTQDLYGITGGVPVDRYIAAKQAEIRALLKRIDEQSAAFLRSSQGGAV